MQLVHPNIFVQSEKQLRNNCSWLKCQNVIECNLSIIKNNGKRPDKWIIIKVNSSKHFWK